MLSDITPHSTRFNKQTCDCRNSELDAACVLPYRLARRTWYQGRRQVSFGTAPYRKNATTRECPCNGPGEAGKPMLRSNDVTPCMKTGNAFWIPSTFITWHDPFCCLSHTLVRTPLACWRRRYSNFEIRSRLLQPKRFSVCDQKHQCNVYCSNVRCHSENPDQQGTQLTWQNCRLNRLKFWPK